MEQNRNNSHNMTHIVVNWPLTKEQSQYSGAKIVFSTNSAGTTGHLYEKKIQTQTLRSSQKINSKWTIDLKCRSVKLLADNIGENLKDLGYGNDFRYSNEGIIPERNHW